MPAARPHFVVVDTETTGLDPLTDRIIDVGAVRLDEDLAVVDRFTTLVDPGLPVPLFVSRLTGITDADVAGAPSAGEALELLREFAGDALLVGHNAAFDREMLAAAARRNGAAPLGAAWFDTLEAALLLFPELDRHALPVLVEEFGLDRPAHRALPDAEATAEVLGRLACRAAGLADVERGLLQRVNWAPLAVLDACRATPDQAPPPLVADEPPEGPGPLAVLPVASDGWRAELDGGDLDEPGLAGRLAGFRRRPGQVEYAEATAHMFERGGVAVFEAGTGMGKSLGYLLPAAFAGAAGGRRIVVSTKTKALQRQLARAELPLVAESLPPGWRWALLMGRENYLCRRRLDEAVANEAESLPDPDRALALAYLAGRARRGDVDLSALPYRASLVLPALPDLARELKSSRATCLGRFCPARRRCHWRLARSRAEAAHLVCVNHALLLSGRETLPAFEDVVIDEAHLLYHEATEAFSDRVDSLSVDQLLGDLRGRHRQRALPQRLRAAARKLPPDESRALVAAADACERGAEEAPALSRAVGESVAALAAAASRAGQDGEGGPDSDGRRNDQYTTTVWLTAGLRDLPEHDRFLVDAGLLAESLGRLSMAAAGGAEVLPEGHREHAALLTLSDDAAAAAELLGDVPEGGGPETVAWAELEGAARSLPGAPRWALTRAPVTPAGGLREILWERLRSAVLTSATLTVAGSFAYFREMTGLTGEVDARERVFPSPFDYHRQAVLVLEHDPGGAWRPDDLAARQGERLKDIAEVTGGRTLALFTNKRDMHRVAAAVGEHVEDDGVLVLAQGLHGSAATLAEEFRLHPETILLGVDTLWTGQDFPGDALTCLVIAKLPFPRLDPLFRARRRACEEAGERWFERFYLPEAVLKFRQGFGRLIRTESDSGVIVVLDHRLTQKTYRKDFLASLPEMEVVEAAPAGVAAAVEYHLRRLTAEAAAPV
jgi:DNA polymerase III epsilon subunit family exonuclease